MTIQIDSREHKWELARIQRQLTSLGCKTIVSKLYVGDYQSLDNPRLVIDRKKDLLELCSNVTQQHERFQRESHSLQEPQMAKACIDPYARSATGTTSSLSFAQSITLVRKSWSC